MTRLLCLYLLLAPFAPDAFSQALVKHVIVVSIDGAKPSTIANTDLPVLKLLVKEGAHSWKAQTILPCLTLPSHASMVSGVELSEHGLSWNSYQPQLGLIKVTTMFAIAKAGGFSTSFHTAKDKLKHLNLPGSFDNFSYKKQSDRLVAEDAAAHIKAVKPGLALVHLAGVDTAGHDSGWDSPKYMEALKAADVAVGLIRRAIEEAGIGSETILIVTADHGGKDKTHALPIPENTTIPWIIWGKKVKAGLDIKSSVSTMDTAATSLRALGITVPKGWKGVPVEEALLP